MKGFTKFVIIWTVLITLTIIGGIFSLVGVTLVNSVFTDVGIVLSSMALVGHIICIVLYKHISDDTVEEEEK